uniref:LPD29 domain-containing protein n=1 Tax=Cellulomonas sp. Y8 TaxID=2591145 RepID=UPI003D72C579
MTETITTTQAAAMLKAALQAAYPDVTFSVRRNRGTAANWLRVFYTDGPTGRAVHKITDQYTSLRYDGQSEDQVPARLVAFDGEDVPRLVRYAVSGVAVHRTMGPAGRAAAAARIAAAAPGIKCLDDDGNLTHAALSPQVAERLGGPHWAHGPATVHDIAWPVFCDL